jgi:cellulose synthase/poly-beta-1,6-N-acetylglucosamine synthase-like glycosyltransferase
VQVLDDSTDETRRIAEEAAERWRSAGVDIRCIHRSDRTGFKAGALENGLRSATGEFVAIFDADFIPQPDFLQRAIHFFTDPEIGMVQGRWAHLNRSYSLLTRIQAIYLDGHFMLESFTRSQSGRFFNFNGTAGIIRRSVIEDAGGWQHDTLTEDLDLSYRAQLEGWRFVFLPDLPVPAELPAEMNSFKVQQCRWSKGAMQTAIKLLPRLLRADLSRARKIEAWYHLTGNITYPMMLLLSLILFPAMIVRFNQGLFELLLFDLPLFILAFSSVSCFYITAQRSLHRDWLRRILYLPGLMAVGIGMSVAGSKAVLEGALGIRSDFLRTPKFSLRGRTGNWREKKYRGHQGILPIIELTLGIYFGYVTYYAWDMGIYGVIPFLLLFLSGFLYMGIMSLAQDAGRRSLVPPLRTRIHPRPLGPFTH